MYFCQGLGFVRGVSVPENFPYNIGELISTYTTCRGSLEKSSTTIPRNAILII